MGKRRNRDWLSIITKFVQSGQEQQRIKTGSESTARQTAWRLRPRFKGWVRVEADRGYVVLRRI